MTSRVIETIGNKAFNIPPRQSTSGSLPLLHETLTLDSTSTPSWGGSCTFEIKEFGFVNDVGLILELSAIGGLTGSVANFPHYVPGQLMIDKVEYKLVPSDTAQISYGLEQFISGNLFNEDSKRVLTNNAQGNYNSLAQRNALAIVQSRYPIDLTSFIPQTHLAVVSEKTKIVVKVSFVNANSVVNQSTLTGTPTTSIISAKLSVGMSRLSVSHLDQLTNQLTKSINHYRYLQVVTQSQQVISGANAVSFKLTNFQGQLSFFYFVVRPLSGLTGNSQYSFTAIRDFEVKTSTGTSLCGGNPISHSMALFYINRNWVRSSFQSESGMNVYLYSYSPDPAEAFESGVGVNAYNYTGDELLTINFNSALGSAHQVDCYGYINAILGVKNEGHTLHTF